MNIDGMDQTREELTGLLATLQEGYSLRDVARHDDYARRLFVPGDDMRILGTSDGEWQLGYENARKLLESDWQYWGDVTIDWAGAEWTAGQDSAWFHTTGTVAQDFSLSEATYEAFVDNVRGYLNEDPCWLGPVSDETRLTTISWELTHLLTGQGRLSRWQFRLSGVAVRWESGWRFSQLQFALPVTGYPDERFWPENIYRRYHDQVAERLRAHGGAGDFPDIRRVMERFCRGFTDRGIASGQLVSEFFSQAADVRWLGTSMAIGRGVREVSAELDHQRSCWDSLELELAGMRISRQGDTAWLLTQGEAAKTRTRQAAVALEMEKAREILDGPLTARDKLHRINRNIITMFSEMSKGEDLQWPIRCGAVLVRESGRWVIHTLQWYYPSNIILEGKTDAAEKM